ncbi:hypothetical protein [uncultured Eubacterium sp.]|uniref:hypothetical protein n=1 Tax=uncultured Eubacterium sp. TaxID=165185 RepID=UPI0025995EAB|nr:hypothetical protein [uncultured Eubacterium sp.]
MKEPEIDLWNMIKQEWEYFYSHYREYDEKRMINIVMPDDAYQMALKCDMCDTQRREISQKGDGLNKINGTVLLAPSCDKSTTVLVPKQAMLGRSLAEIRGTIIHELTHANDFYDYLEFLNIDNYDKVFADVYYNAFFNWTEFHARQLGYKRYVEYTFIKSWKLFKKSKKNLLENICLNFNNHTENGIKYDLMQAMGRYYSFCSLSGSAMKMNFKEDILKGNVDATVLDEYEEIYEFLCEHREFDVFIKDIEEFQKLLDSIEE